MSRGSLHAWPVKRTLTMRSSVLTVDELSQGAKLTLGHGPWLGHG